MNKNYSPLSAKHRAAPPPCRGAHAAGFTLTEILVAIALVITIVGVAVVNLLNILESSRVDAARMFVKTSLSAPLLKYKTDTGAFPSTAEGIAALVAAPEGAGGWSGPYLEEKAVPLDPWKTPYHYAFPGPHNGPAKYDLFSAGPDKAAGTGDDIVNW